MNTFLLLSTLGLGAIWCGVLLAFCFLFIHVIKLAKIGLDVTKKEKKPQTKSTPTQKTPDGQTPSGEKSVFYFIERTKQGKRVVYKKPKRLHFK